MKIVDGQMVKRQPEEMKGSGVKWLGKIPKGWERARLKQLVSLKITDGPHETPEFFDSGIPFLSAEAIVNSEISFPNMRGYISENQYKVYKRNAMFY
ncbi:MAG: hypothetical protein KAX49_12600 [Halanaerobiales bacterium]|nr:hypothetical protein [Halanaerobiales bacterium]